MRDSIMIEPPEIRYLNAYVSDSSFSTSFQEMAYSKGLSCNTLSRINDFLIYLKHSVVDRDCLPNSHILSSASSGRPL